MGRGECDEARNGCKRKATSAVATRCHNGSRAMFRSINDGRLFVQWKEPVLSAKRDEPKQCVLFTFASSRGRLLQSSRTKFGSMVSSTVVDVSYHPQLED
eukprot:GHVS01033353.1.p3 GENE.GHVS01033353.1~~GHVS01033353.1.p3  ORF type:complete len:100 (-),score=0.43 GHVS01033353.1:129-428(-)